MASTGRTLLVPVSARAAAEWDSEGQPVAYVAEAAWAEVTSTEVEVVPVFEARFAPWPP